LIRINIGDQLRQRVGFQMAPLIDIMFNTLVLFMVISVLQSMETELSISVPKAQESKDISRSPGEIIINVERDGTMIVNQKRLDRRGLEDVLQKLSALYPNQPVIIRADARAYHEAVVRVLDACAGAGIWNVSFSTIKEPTEN